MPRFQELLNQKFAEHPEAKGMMLVIEAPDHGISWRGAVGWAEQEKQRKLSTDIPVIIASNTKEYVAAATLRLVEMGKITLNQPIADLISSTSKATLESDGYDLEAITVHHLIAQTSGIFDYVHTDRYQQRTIHEPEYVWTHDEQIALAVSDGQKIAEPGEQFTYSDSNFLLLSEILASQTKKPFYQAVRELLKYETIGLKHTWFNLLEEHPATLAKRAHQFSTQYQVDSYSLHGTFDLFGGGGIVATMPDLCRFHRALMTEQIFEDASSLKLMMTPVEQDSADAPQFCHGLMRWDLAGFQSYSYAGFWGTQVHHVPELNATIAVCMMERDNWPVNLELTESVLNYLKTRK